MNAELVAIGTEILLGEITDTNSTHIARTLRDHGVNVFYFTAVGDNMERITNTLRNALERSDLIITTGGLGPTVDDMTRQAVAAATDRELVFHQHLLDSIAERFRQFGVVMSENNRLQAYVPAEAIILENPVGTAPCFIVESAKGTIISLPGVPREMKYLLEKSVIPYIRQKMGLPAIIKARILKTAGIGESMVDERIADFMTHTNPTVGLAAHGGQTDIRITARAASEAEADAMIAVTEAAIRERVGDYIYGIDKEAMDALVLKLLAERDSGLVLIEAGTGATFNKRLQTLPHADRIHTLIEHPEAGALRAALNLPDAPLRDLAEAAVKHYRQRHGQPIAVAVLAEGDLLALGVETPKGVFARSLGSMVATDDIPRWAGNWGLGMVWRYLREEGLA